MDYMDLKTSCVKEHNWCLSQTRLVTEIDLSFGLLLESFGRVSETPRQDILLKQQGIIQ